MNFVIRVVTPFAPFAVLAAEPPTSSEITTTTLPAVTVRDTAPAGLRYQVPSTTESVTAAHIAETINVMNTEDALRYLPGLVLRKRNFGDQQSPVATRTSGLGQSARSLIYADGILLSAHIGNNNSGASPRWALVAPEEIDRIDVMYGPYPAAYPGNAMGAVIDITTRMPQSLEAMAKLTTAWQGYSLYGTKDTYSSQQIGALFGNRTGDLSYLLSVNHLDTDTQPVNIATALRPANPSGAGTPVTGAYFDQNRLGQPIAVIGSGGLERKTQDTLKLKLAWDLTSAIRATYTLGYFQNDARSRVETYLRDAAGNPVYSGTSLNIGGYNFTNIGTSAFSGASGFYHLAQEHVGQSLTVRSNTQGLFDWDVSASSMRYGLDTFRFPGTALPAGSNGGPGSIQSMTGTGWTTLDFKGIWRPQGPRGAHHVSFGAHADRYRLDSATYATTDWIAGSIGAQTARSDGKTDTDALWVQDAWQFAPNMKLTLGGRQERWRAHDGLNFVASPASSVSQPDIHATRFSPKASFAWDATREWRLSASYGTAYRFPTVTELYQAVTVNGVVFTPNPNLRPEHARSTELAAEHALHRGRLRLSLFQEALSDALIAQNSTIPGTNVVGSSIQNIDRVRSRGIEFVGEKSDAILPGLDLFASVTWVDSRILSDPGFRDASGALADVTGKKTPNIPRLKWTAVATYRHDAQWSTTLAARYSARVWATLDNTDVATHTWQGFDSFLVMDARLHYRTSRNATVALGVENLTDRRYFLFHPFPQRTVLMELRMAI